ncbi:MAG: voltage-gated potassium channel [Flavobacterium sp.]|jgi:voltage-gated potassium channel
MLRIKIDRFRRHRYDQYRFLNTDRRKEKVFSLLRLLIILIGLNTIAMMIFEDLSLENAVWLTMTTITTVGYGDLSPSSLEGRAATIVLLYIFGISLLAQLAGEWIDFRMDRRERMRKGLWRWKMKNHIVIINSPDKNGAKYLRTLIEQIRKSTNLADFPIQIFTPNFPDGLPNEISSLGVALRQGQPEGRSDMKEVDVENAAFIVVLAVDSSDYRSDSLTLDILDQLSHFKLDGHIIAECVQDENRIRLRSHGANAVIRPVRAYPELMVRAMDAPGTELILENLFEHEGVHPRRYNVDISKQTWGDVAIKVIGAGLGTPLGFIDTEGELIINPQPDKSVKGTAFFLMVNHDHIADEEEFDRIVNGSSSS